MIMYVITGIIFLLIAVNYYLGYSLYKLPNNESYFSNIRNYNIINKKVIMASPKYVTIISMLLGILIGTYICLGNIYSINGYIKWGTVFILIVLYLIEITRKITITDDDLELEKLFTPIKRIPLNSITGMYVYSYNKKFLDKRAFTTKLVVSTRNEKYKFTLSSIDVRAVINMMKDNFGITDNKMYVAHK